MPRRNREVRRVHCPSLSFTQGISDELKRRGETPMRVFFYPDSTSLIRHQPDPKESARKISRNKIRPGTAGAGGHYWATHVEPVRCLDLRGILDDVVGARGRGPC